MICKNHYEASLAQRGYTFGGIFHDHRESAFSVAWKDRTAGRELFNVIKPGDIIVVAKLCRAFRNLRDRENTMHFLTQVGIDLCILDVGMDNTTAAGKFAAGIIALQCQWESDVKSERQKAAHVIGRQRKTPGRRHPPPGWKWDKLAAELVPDLRERKLLELIYQWRANRVRGIKDTLPMAHGRRHPKRFGGDVQRPVGSAGVDVSTEGLAAGGLRPEFLAQS